MGKTSIEWTDRTWNPIIGCSPASAGCEHCYAARTAHRLSHIATTKDLYSGLTRRTNNGIRFNGQTRAIPERFTEPLSWRKPNKVFVCSMGDLFHKTVDLSHQIDLFKVMAECKHHTFQILTKRPAVMREKLAHIRSCVDTWPIPNVWLGTSIDTHFSSHRIDELKECDAALRFISFEPLLGRIPSPNLSRIGWVIVGGENGPGARPMDFAWAREIRDACMEQGVPFFYKGSGAGRKNESIPTLDGITWHQFPA